MCGQHLSECKASRAMLVLRDGDVSVLIKGSAHFANSNSMEM